MLDLWVFALHVGGGVEGAVGGGTEQQKWKTCRWFVVERGT